MRVHEEHLLTSVLYSGRDSERLVKCNSIRKYTGEGVAFLILPSLAIIHREVSIQLLVAMWFWLLLVSFAQLPMAQQIMAGMAVFRFEPDL